jgi:pimeloyl-ACP methyl ester carboxylesterase
VRRPHNKRNHVAHSSAKAELKYDLVSRMCKHKTFVAGTIVSLLLLGYRTMIAQNPIKVNMGSHTLSVYPVGRGSPTVVIDVGFGESAKGWQQVVDSISKETRVVTYDRAGYGESTPGPLPRNCGQAVSELEKALNVANIEPPYVLIGHSLGGMNAQYFAKQFPKSVVGLVLLDPPPLKWISGKADFPDLDTLANQQTQSFLAIAKSASESDKPEDKAKAAFFRTLASENKELFESSAQQVASIESFGTLPLTVMAAGKPNPMFGKSAERFQRFWIDESKDISSKSTRGCFVLIENSTHHIHRDAPQRVIAEIRQMLSSIRQN